MAHFARLDENNVVIAVHPVDNINCINFEGYESEEIGIAYCKSFYDPIYNEDTRWIQTSYNNKIRHRYAGVGMIYNAEHDVFLYPQPYPSWTLNTETFEWEPPIPEPELTEEQIKSGSYYEWNEETQEWKLETAT